MLLLAAGVLPCSLASFSPARGAAPGPVRVMPLGDSITESSGGFASYRMLLSLFAGPLGPPPSDECRMDPAGDGLNGGDFPPCRSPR